MAITGGVCIPYLQMGSSDKNYEQTLKDYLECMDEDTKTPDHIYQEKLSARSQCELLRSGMCRLYGCPVTLRVAKIHDHCADTPVE